jgi:hypothetical protein
LSQRLPVKREPTKVPRERHGRNPGHSWPGGCQSPGHSTCSSQGLQYWPLVPAPAGAGVPAVQGISAPLATTKATSGASMATAGGWPLSSFVKDKAPGDVAGEGVKTFGGTWCAVSPSGTAVMAPVKTAPANSGGGSGGGGGYGY